ncbi:MAG: WbqC family protein [Lentisphaerae bacterium]|nr:WbqC family protein [Lentisphaerota bacterium]
MTNDVTTNPKRCAIHQPQFLPWLGYFDKISTADIFVFLDDVQFKKNEFQNRNKILVRGEAKWLTVPAKFNFGDTIRQTEPANDRAWAKKMIRTLELNYARTQYFATFKNGLFDILEHEWRSLAELNMATVLWLMDCFHIRTETRLSSAMQGLSHNPTRRLIDICNYSGSTTYLSGAGGRNYLDLNAFAEAGITVEFQDFLHPTYTQWYTSQHGFVSNLSAIDMLFNCGDKWPINRKDADR